MKESSSFTHMPFPRAIKNKHEVGAFQSNASQQLRLHLLSTVITVSDHNDGEASTTSIIKVEPRQVGLETNREGFYQCLSHLSNVSRELTKADRVLIVNWS